MNTFILSLMFMFGISFSGNTNPQSMDTSNHAGSYSCTDCWGYADGFELETGAGYEAWLSAYDYCNNNLKPCAAQLEPVTI